MRFPASLPLWRRATPIASLLVAGTALLAAPAAPAGASSDASAARMAVAQPRTVARQAKNAGLGERVLTNLKGRTLYTLSAEVKGRFICTGSCLGTWHPLVISKGVKPVGPAKLGRVTRPDGRIQVTFKGRPLYTFSGDTRAGQANGQGFKDVGTWHAASLGKIRSSSNPSQPKPENPYPY